MQQQRRKFVICFITTTSSYFLRRKQLTLIYRQLKDAHCVTVLMLPASADIGKPRRRIL
jgi:hypothetical protein